MIRKYEKSYKIGLDNENGSAKLIKALNSKTRRNILRILANGSMTIYSLAINLNIPLSTISEHIKILANAGLITVFGRNDGRGRGKMVTRQYEKIQISLCEAKDEEHNSHSYSQHIGIGSYSSFNINKYCGIVGEEGYIGSRDDKNSFYAPNRFSAQIIWFDYGYLEYTVPLLDKDVSKLSSLSISLELCSEAPDYNETWKSDIYFEINSKEVCTYTAPGDYGARHGKITPSWWNEGTQYGLMKNIEVNSKGTFLDNNLVSNVTIRELNINKNPIIKFRIGVRENAKYRGGINLFGKKFGDYSQHIILTTTYEE